VITEAFARQFAEAWVQAWNTRDLQAVLTHYTEDFEMSSPYIAQIAGEQSGTLKGKKAVAAYWAKALEKLPDLHFELITVLAGAHSVTIYYRGQKKRLVAEVLFFAADGKVEKAFAHYADA
jgi:hypothetical protein